MEYTSLFLCLLWFLSLSVHAIYKKERTSKYYQRISYSNFFKKYFIFLSHKFKIFKNTIFYLRLHPNLFNENKTIKEKLENSKQEDDSFEWRQYCLDPLYTNFNQVMQNLDNFTNNCYNTSILESTNFGINNLKDKNNTIQRLVNPQLLNATGFFRYKI